MIYLDIIAEILETDRIAEEKLSSAQSQKTEIINQSENEISALKEKAEKDFSQYCNKKHGEISAVTEEKVQAVRDSAEKKQKEFDKLYWENHKKWETEIFEKLWEE